MRRIIFFLFLIGIGVRAQQSSIDTLTLERAVQLALEYHPSIFSADAAVRSANATLTQAQASYYPTITASGSYTRTEGAFVFNPAFPPRIQFYDNFSTTIAVSQTLFDFGRMVHRVSSSGQVLTAAESDALSIKENVVANVQIAYYALIQATMIIHVTDEAVKRAEDHLARAKAFFEVGRRPQFDVTKAEVDLANAQVNLLRAENQQQLTKVQLENMMGVHPKNSFTVKGDFLVESFSMSLDSAKLIALETRPELISARARLEAAHSLISAAWAQNLPVFSASYNWTWSNFHFPLVNRWNAGISFSVPLFQGFSISAQVEQAQANADAAEANLRLLIESVNTEVEQNYLALKEAMERVRATSKLVEQAELNFRLAERQYAAGVGAALEVADAELALSNARITRIQAMFDYNNYLVRLRRAMGIGCREFGR
jgi:outer membrane protein TolC